MPQLKVQAREVRVSDELHVLRSARIGPGADGDDCSVQLDGRLARPVRQQPPPHLTRVSLEVSLHAR